MSKNKKSNECEWPIYIKKAIEHNNIIKKSLKKIWYEIKEFKNENRIWSSKEKDYDINEKINIKNLIEKFKRSKKNYIRLSSNDLLFIKQRLKITIKLLILMNIHMNIIIYQLSKN